MSQFHGTLEGQSRTRATRRGGKNSGIKVQAASWAGAIETRIFVDSQGIECFEVSMIPWKSRGDARVIASGIVGKAGSVEFGAI